VNTHCSKFRRRNSYVPILALVVNTIDRMILVRHALPDVRPDVPAEHWELAESGREAARALAGAVPGPCHYVASDELKAMQTMQEMSGGEAVVPEPGFREVRRPHRWADGYREKARAYIEGVRHDGWEGHVEAISRFEEAMFRHGLIAAARQRTLVVGTHGLAPTVWLASRLPLEPTAADFWAGLRFPDVIRVDLVARRADRLNTSTNSPR
jgi:broad specificity phosphatase PhoE